MKRLLVLVLMALLPTLLLPLCAVHAQFAEVPALRSRVTDLTGILGSQIEPLREQLRLLEDEKGSQVAVLVVNSTNPETIEQFSIRVVDQWKLGRRGIDDGVLLLVALKDRKVRIEVGRGLEGDIPDAIAHRIIDEQILPRFREGAVPKGIEAGVHALIGLIRGVPLPLPKGGGAGQGVGGFWAGFIIGFIAAIIAVVGQYNSRSYGFNSGSGFRGSGGGFRSGGGFSGGGGSFSGGGASGGW